MRHRQTVRFTVIGTTEVVPKVWNFWFVIYIVLLAPGLYEGGHEQTNEMICWTHVEMSRNDCSYEAQCGRLWPQALALHTDSTTQASTLGASGFA